MNCLDEKRIIITRSEEETGRLGRCLGRWAKAGQVYALSGDLGAGKTVLARGFAQGLEVRETVTSPTFTLMQIYETGRLPLCHMDAYRLADESELEAVGGHEYLEGEGVSLVEWPELVEGLLPSHTIRIRIQRLPREGEDLRRITIQGEVPDDCFSD